MKIIYILALLSLSVSCKNSDNSNLSESNNNENLNVIPDSTIKNNQLNINYLIKELFKKAIQLKDFSFTEKQIKSKWIGNSPAKETEINNLEERLKIKLPKDYIELLKVSNGFLAPNQVEPSFLKAGQVDYYKNIEPEGLNIWIQTNKSDINLISKLSRSIIIAGINEEQSFLLIPPKSKRDTWEYWKFANWIPGEEKYINLKEYIIGVTDFINQELEE